MQDFGPLILQMLRPQATREPLLQPLLVLIVVSSKHTLGRSYIFNLLSVDVSWYQAN